LDECIAKDEDFNTAYFAQTVFGIPCDAVGKPMKSKQGHHEVTQPLMVLDCMLKWNIYGPEENRSSRNR
jgi:hypothetical protein